MERLLRGIFAGFIVGIALAMLAAWLGLQTSNDLRLHKIAWVCSTMPACVEAYDDSGINDDSGSPDSDTYADPIMY